MRDDRLKWRAPDRGDTRSLQIEGLTLKRRRPERQTLISGPRDTAVALVGLQAAIGWPEVVRSKAYAVSMRRDRILAVDTPPVPAGWLEAQGLAVSDVTDGYEIVDVSGVRALDFLKTGAELSLQPASASALRLWHGFGILLYRHRDDQSYRLHVSRAQAEGLWDMMEAQLHGLERQ